MIKKLCKGCNQELSVELFSSRYDRGTPQYQALCKQCHSNYRKAHYEKNKSKYIEKSTKYRKETEDWFIKEIKEHLSCINCGESRHWVLDFHHKNFTNKEGNISDLLRRGSRKKLLDELEKCEVLCSNCHRDLHYQEK